MNDFEEKNVYTYSYQPKSWDRFIDDILAIFTEGRDKLNIFLEHLNSCHENIKFTVEISDTSVTFLHTVITLNSNGTLSTSLYCKCTDAHNYLQYSSSHPRHCVTTCSMPYSQFLRVRRICSSEQDFIDKAISMGKDFLRRDYPLTLVENLTEKPKNIKNTDDSLFAITTYHPSFNSFRNIITNNWPLLNRSINTKRLHDQRIIFGHRRNKNLRELLTQAKVEYPKKQNL